MCCGENTKEGKIKWREYERGEGSLRGEYKKKNIGKRNVTKGKKCERTFISKDNYDDSKCHISKDNYDDYEVVVLYS